MLMVKPGLPYLDLVREVKDKVSTEWRWESLSPTVDLKWRGQKQCVPEQEPSAPLAHPCLGTGLSLLHGAQEPLDSSGWTVSE